MMCYRAPAHTHTQELGRDPVCRFMARKQREGACGSNHEWNAVRLWEVVKMGAYMTPMSVCRACGTHRLTHACAERVFGGRTGEAKCVQCKCVPATL